MLNIHLLVKCMVFFLKYYNINVHVLTTLATFTQQVEQNNAFYKQYH
jgi:hypothetical protein